MTEGCKRLWVAVLEQAVDDLRRGYSHATPARDWFRSDSEEVGSFIWTCRMLGIDPEFRHRLLAKSRPTPQITRTINPSPYDHSTPNVIVAIDR
jgi:hypothetical protein